MSTSIPVFTSRWGFHPCDYECFVKLKRLHKWYWQTICDFHRWHRWQRKEPQNRRGPEPRYCPLFAEDRIWYKRVKFHGEEGFKVYPRTIVDLGIPDLYEQARLPQPGPVPVFSEETRNRILELHDKAALYFSE